MQVRDFVLRRADYALTDEQRALRESFARLLGNECPTDRVRDAEPLGFDEKLWRQLVEVGATGLGLPEEVGGEGGGLVELVLAAEQLGRALAPVPFIEATVAARLLTRCGQPPDRLQTAVRGDWLATVALHPSHPGAAQLVPAGAIADAVIGLVDDQLVVATSEGQPVHVANHACAPLASWDLTADQVTREVVLDGPAAIEAFASAQREWKLLMAAALVGLADGALQLATDFARERKAFGVPIATFQAVAHPLADCAIAVVGARRLVWRAAWFADHEPANESHLIPMAFLNASRAVVKTTTVGVHIQGGVGFTVESPMQLFFRRAKGWTNVAGDPARQRSVIADALYGPVGI